MTGLFALILVIASLVLGLKGAWRLFGAVFLLAGVAIFGGIYWQFGTLSLSPQEGRDLGTGFALGFFHIFFAISLLIFLIGLSIRGIVGQMIGMRK